MKGFITPHRVLATLAILFAATAIWAITLDLSVVSSLHDAQAEHTDQADLYSLVANGQNDQAFAAAFEHGDEFFETEFNALDGVGANVGDGSRFTRVPRADLKGPGQWASHTPARATGPNAISCNSCHVQLFDDGSGSAAGNVHRDPQHSASLGHFIQRNTPHTFALGAIQRLAEEMTADLLQQRDLARAQACAFSVSSIQLSAKNVSYGSIKATRVNRSPCTVSYDTSKVEGVAADLIIRPFQWKGSIATIRDFNRDAAHNELGMDPVETTGDNVDGDGDGIANEVTIGDITALSVYLASQPRPTTSIELASLGIISPLPADTIRQINAGAAVFNRVGCAQCHIPRLTLDDPTFREPSAMRQYRDDKFPAGQDPVSRKLDPRFPIRVDLTRDQPDNQIKDANGNVVFRLGSLATDGRGHGIVELYGDLKRHYMGQRLAEQIDEVGTGPATFLTRTLWGVGSTAPYMHDGRSTTLTEAILEHGGEAANARAAFLGKSHAEQEALIAFVNSLVLFKMEEGQVVVPPPPATPLTAQMQIKRPTSRSERRDRRVSGAR